MRNERNTVTDSALSAQPAHRAAHNRFPESKPNSHRHERRKVREALRFSGGTQTLAERLC